MYEPLNPFSKGVDREGVDVASRSGSASITTSSSYISCSSCSRSRRCPRGPTSLRLRGRVHSRLRALLVAVIPFPLQQRQHRRLQGSIVGISSGRGERRRVTCLCMYLSFLHLLAHLVRKGGVGCLGPTRRARSALTSAFACVLVWRTFISTMNR